MVMVGSNMSPRRWVAVAFLPLAVHGSNITNSSTMCGPEECLLTLHDTPLLYSWQSYEEVSDLGYSRRPAVHTTSLTATVVTVIDTVWNTTSTTTQMPAGYTPAPTNAQGTRIETISFYTRIGQSDSTILTFPNYFVSWGSGYMWTGTMQATATASSCVTAPDEGSTIPFKSNPQPTSPGDLAILDDYINRKPISDGRGISYVLVVFLFTNYPMLSRLFPDDPAMTLCDEYNPGPNWADFTQTQWATATTTSFTSGGPAPTNRPGGAASSASGAGGGNPNGSPAGGSGGGGQSGGSSGGNSGANQGVGSSGSPAGRPNAGSGGGSVGNPNGGSGESSGTATGKGGDGSSPGRGGSLGGSSGGSSGDSPGGSSGGSSGGSPGGKVGDGAGGSTKGSSDAGSGGRQPGSGSMDSSPASSSGADSDGQAKGSNGESSASRPTSGSGSSEANLATILRPEVLYTGLLVLIMGWCNM